MGDSCKYITAKSIYILVYQDICNVARFYFFKSNEVN